MHALNIHGVNDVRLDRKPQPVLGPSDVLVKVKACGICGSDLSYIKWGGINRHEGSVMPLGHEAAGDVLAVGSQVHDAYPGQRVVINPMNTPSFIGNGGPEGALSEVVLVRDARLGVNLLPIPEGLPYDLAALTEPLAVALHGINQLQIKPEHKVVVFGCGPIGLGMLLWLNVRGVTDIIAVDLSDARLERAKWLGARNFINASREDVRQRIRDLHGSHSFFSRNVANTDRYIDAAGAPNLVSDVIGIAKHQSRMVITATYSKPVQIDLTTMLTTEMTLTTAIGYPTEMQDVLVALPHLQDRVDRMISHRFPFEAVLQGLQVAASSQSAKVMVEFGD